MLDWLFGRKRKRSEYTSDTEWMLDVYPDCHSPKQAKAYAANLEALTSGKISRDEWWRREKAIDAQYNGKEAH